MSAARGAPEWTCTGRTGTAPRRPTTAPRSYTHPTSGRWPRSSMVERDPTQLTLALSIGRPVRGTFALVTRDGGNTLLPTTDADWDDWVSAGALRNWARNDALLDWLDRYGGEHGFARDDQRAAYDERFDFQRFLARQGRRF